MTTRHIAQRALSRMAHNHFYLWRVQRILNRSK